MLITVAGWAVCFAVGVIARRRFDEPRRPSHILFLVTLWVASPLVVFFAYTTVSVGSQFFAALAVAIVASWLMVGVGGGWARAAGRTPAERAVLMMAPATANTAIVGYPMATVVFGGQGLALAVVYSEFQFVIPMVAVMLGIARHFAGPDSHAAQAPGVKAIVRSWLLNPPVAAGVLAVSLRLAGVELDSLVTPVGPAVGVAISMFGFVQLGLAAPLGKLGHDVAELWRAGVTLVLRCGSAPLVLYLVGRLAGVDVPGVFLLLAAMPVAFNTIILAHVYDLDIRLARLLIAVSTPLVVVAVLVWQAT